MAHRLEVASAALVLALALAGGARVLWGWPAWVGPAEVVSSVALVAGAVATLVAVLRGFVGWRIGLAAGVLLAGVAGFVAYLADAWPFAAAVFDDRRHAGLFTVIDTLAVIGLLRRQTWARWVALAMGLITVLTAGGIAVRLLFDDDGARARSSHAWIFLLAALGGALILVNVAGPAVRDAFLSQGPSGALWGSSDRLITSVRWAIVANVVAAPHLLVHAWLADPPPRTAAFMQALAVLLFIAVGLTMARKAIGVVLLSLGGVALAALAVATFREAWSTATLWRSAFDLAISGSAAALSILAGARMARPVLALLRR